MSGQTLTEIRSLLAAHGLSPRHRLGQNFLHDKNQLGKLVSAAQLAPGDRVLEVGPGTGTLTEVLLGAGAQVIAVELDDGLATLVEDRLGDRIELIRGDCLGRRRTVNPEVIERLGGEPFQLIANLPYQVASPLMCALLIDHPNCTGQHITIQLEVADRLAAKCGTKAYGPLSVIVQSLAEVKRIGTIPPGCFWPAPKITSAMVSIVPHADHGIENPAALARFATELFMRRRKQLGSIFGRDRPWPPGIEAQMRPEVLDVGKIKTLMEWAKE